MIAIAGLVLIVGIAVVAVLAARAAHGPAPTRTLAEQLADWTAAGIIDAGQAERLRDHEASRAAPVPPRRPTPATPTTGTPTTGTTTTPSSGVATTVTAPTGSSTTEGTRHVPARPAFAAVVEGLGYLGGVLAVTSVVLLVAHYWQDLELVGQMAISGVTAVALAGGGWAVPEHRAPSMRRLRAFLWTLSTAATAVLATTAAAELVDPPPVAPVVAGGAAAVAVVSGLMWWGRRRPVQQVLALGAIAVAVGAGLVEPTGTTVAGLAVWAVGAAFLAAGIGRRTVDPVIDVMVGSIALGVGAMIAVGADPSIALLLPAGTGAAIVALALLRRLVTEIASIVAMCIVGSMTMLVALPPLLGTMAEHAAVATGTTLWCCGLAVAAVGVRRWTRGSIVLEVAGAAAMLIACAVVAAQEPGIATVAGLLTSLGLLGVSTLPGRVVLSPVGALGLLAFVPWTIGWYFPGAGRVPVLISVSGLLIVGVAVLMARSGHRFGDELGGGRRHAPR